MSLLFKIAIVYKKKKKYLNSGPLAVWGGSFEPTEKIQKDFIAHENSVMVCTRHGNKTFRALLKNIRGFSPSTASRPPY